MRSVSISPRLVERLVRWSTAREGREACGALIGTRGDDSCVITDVAEIENRAALPDAFECDPAAIVVLDRRATTLGLGILGFWHSHASGAGEPSTRDASGAWSSALTAIVCPHRTPAVRFWRFEGAFAVEVSRAPMGTCMPRGVADNSRPGERP